MITCFNYALHRVKVQYSFSGGSQFHSRWCLASPKVQVLLDNGQLMLKNYSSSRVHTTKKDEKGNGVETYY